MHNRNSLQKDTYYNHAGFSGSLIPKVCKSVENRKWKIISFKIITSNINKENQH